MTTAIFIPRAPWRMPTALAVSLAVHAMLLSIVVGGQAFGLPGLALPWQEKRIGADDLRIQLAPAPVPLPLPDARPTGTSAAPLPGASEPRTAPAPAAPPAPAASGAIRALAPATPVASEPDPAPAPAVQPDQAAPAAQERAVELARVERDAQDAQRLRETELIAIARREAAQRAQVQLETARAEEAARMAELARQDALRRAAAQQASALAEQARQQQDRAALAEAEREEQARQAALRDEQARQQQAKLEQARQEQAKLEQARQEQTKLDQAKQELARQQQAQQQQAQQQQAQQQRAQQQQLTQVQATQDRAQRERADQEAQREERLRAIGRQLNAEAAQRDGAAGPSRSLLPGVSGLRRGWLLGRADANAQLVQYAETMAQKIELNMTFDMVRDVVRQPHVAPIVTMAIRADGSVEKVTFDVSSGVPAIDAAIRRVIASQAPYAAFPPALARQYDVVEIRRTWNIDTAIRLQ